ncbi:ribonuclease I [Escherichia coli]|uniref:Ribonuclease I n=1 Tax=Escherichia coli TaxID=562 RepID=A0A376TJ79_ECOLX|nr:ribonuclease I [Escherichia coli]
MKAFWRNAALLAVSLLPFSSANALALQAKQYGDLIAMSWPSPGKPDFARVNTIEIVTNEMNVACKPKRPTKLIF